MRAAALPPLLARLCSLRHDIGAACRSAQEEAKNEISMPHRQAGRHAAAVLIVGDATRV